jgi:heat shock protein HslJ
MKVSMSKGAILMKQAFTRFTTAAVLLVLVLFAAACAPKPTTEAASTSPITEVIWQWTSVKDQSTGKTTTVPKPENYTISFNTDGTFEGKADCNAIAGTYTYTPSNGSISIKLGPSTLMACAPDSLDQQYLQLLSSIAAGGPDGKGHLALETAGGTQRMEFKNGGAVKR